MITEADISDITGKAPHNIDIFRQAFVHKSCKGQESNERLEFLGDAVLNLIVGCDLYLKYPNENEGFLTRVRTRLVNGKTLSQLACTLGFNNHVVMNDRAMKNEWNNNPRILEDAFEAFIGSMFLDRGYDETKLWVLQILNEHVKDVDITNDTNYKDILMKYMQSKGHSVEFKLIKETGNHTEKRFFVQALIDGLLMAESQGSTKKAAEQEVSLITL